MSLRCIQLNLQISDLGDACVLIDRFALSLGLKFSGPNLEGLRCWASTWVCRTDWGLVQGKGAQKAMRGALGLWEDAGAVRRRREHGEAGAGGNGEVAAPPREHARLQRVKAADEADLQATDANSVRGDRIRICVGGHFSPRLEKGAVSVCVLRVAGRRNFST